MNYLHVAIIEDLEECLVSHSEADLRIQVASALAKESIAPFTDEEWADCVKGEDDKVVTTDCLTLTVVTYYKIESKLEE